VADSIARLADELAEIRDLPRAQLRVAVVTAVESTVERRVRVDLAGDAWIATDTDSALAVGDRVYAIQQGNVWVISGRLDGTTAAPPIGSMTMFAGWTDRPPAGWLPCDGRALVRADYPALFSLLGTNYGAGNGTTTFNLPNMLGRFPVGSGGDGSTWWLGKTGGSETVALTTAQVPSHSHSMTHTHSIAHTHTVPSAAGDSTVASGTGATVASSATATTSAASTGTSGGSSETATGNAGSGDSHENMPPYVGVVFIIRVR